MIKFIAGRRGLPFSKRYTPRDRRAIGIAVIVLGIFTFGLAANLFRLNHEFDGPTTKVMGIVEALYPSTSSRSNPNVAYRYPIGNIDLHVVAPVSQEVFDGLHIGRPLPVKFLPDDPTTNRIDLPAINSERNEAPYYMSGLSILIVGAGTYVFRKARSDLRLKRHHA